MPGRGTEFQGCHPKPLGYAKWRNRNTSDKPFLKEFKPVQQLRRNEGKEKETDSRSYWGSLNQEVISKQKKNRNK